jgi:type VII secretion effector (TIGR04197 family)
MQVTAQTSEKNKRIENLLDGVFEDLSDLTEENFDQKFQSAKSKMELAGKVKVENSSKLTSFKPSKKVIQMAKLISEKYDNVIKDWADKLKVVQKEIELTQNQKKITIYNR